METEESDSGAEMRAFSIKKKRKRKTHKTLGSLREASKQPICGAGHQSVHETLQEQQTHAQLSRPVCGSHVATEKK